jgi:hypothetical protein
MFPNPSGATTPVASITSKPPKNDDLDGVVPASRSNAEAPSVKSPEPHWDSVIGAATD